MVSSGKTKNKFWIILSVIIFLILAGSIIGYAILDKPLPQGKTGPEADAIARKLMEAVNISAWENTAAVSWNFAGRNQHLWDRERHFSRVEWDDYSVLVNLNTQQGIAYSGGKRVGGEEEAELVQTAYERWINDAFWLNPIAKFFDPGTRRELVDLPDGAQGLLLTYTSGGVTPGDSYLWFYGRDGMPNRWELWVSIIPVGGVGFSWENWITLSTGAKISTLHQGPVELRLTEVKGDTTLSNLVPGEDPFASLEDLLGN